MKTLYYIAITPPEPIATEIKNFKLYAGEHFGSYHALRSPAHVTLVPPFHWAVAEIEAIKEALTSFAALQHSFSVAYQNFNCFEPRVVFVDIAPSETLTLLKNNLDEYLKLSLDFTIKSKHKTFNPHTTIAYRYSEESQFKAAWAYFSSQIYKAPFEINEIVLFKHQKEIGWEIDGRFEFD